jgi:prolipoprotein diacylglyceryl transferase
MDVAYIPSPSNAVWNLGPLPLRGYALCIVAGIVACILIGERRLVARGAAPGVLSDIAMWAVPFGIVGGRIYHVITTPEPYFGKGGDPASALYIWEGGLGIWGAISFGAVGAYIGIRRSGVLMPVLADAIAPGLLMAHALGRWGNWFNQELYGRPTDLPWALEIDPEHRPQETAGEGLYHPTYLYESIWCLAGIAVLLWAENRFKLGHGRVFALYVMIYTAGRGWIEMLRVDTAHEIFGLRLNVWTSIVLFAGAAVGLALSARKLPGQEASAYRDGHRHEPDPPAAGEAKTVP